jgi:uncharacterized protein (TIGR03067 family)
MRPGTALIVAACVVVVGLAQDAGKKADDVARKELALLQGKWVMIGREVLGKKATKEDLEKVKGIRVVEGNKVTSWAVERGKKMEDVTEATIKLDPAAKPKAIDQTIIKGRFKGDTALGIYKLDGDELTICIAWGSEERPTEFAGKLDGKAMLVIYKRVKE